MNFEVAFKPQLGCGLFPALVSPQGARSADYRVLRDYLSDQIEQVERALCDRGAILFRGFNLRSTREFEAVFQSFNSHAHAGYAGVSPRTPLSQSVYTSTDAPPGFRIIPHQERAYLSEHPRKLAFFCNVAAEVGGETSLCDMRRVTLALPHELFDKAKKRGVRYTRTFIDPSSIADSPLSRAFSAYRRSWVQVFNSTSRADVSEACELLNLDYDWLPSGSLRTVYRAPGAIPLPTGDEFIWFNQIATLHPNEISLGSAYSLYQQLIVACPELPQVVEWGDGTPISFAEIRPLYRALDQTRFELRWEPGDVLLLDNINVAHGRNPYRGKRDVQVMMFD